MLESTKVDHGFPSTRTLVHGTRYKYCTGYLYCTRYLIRRESTLACLVTLGRPEVRLTAKRATRLSATDTLNIKHSTVPVYPLSISSSPMEAMQHDRLSNNASTGWHSAPGNVPGVRQPPADPSHPAAASEFSSMPPGLRETDVRFGRGNGTNRHPGNAFLRELVGERREDFGRAVDAAARGQVVEDIVHLVKTQNPPGRFVRKDATCVSGGGWREADAQDVRRKVIDALRDSVRGRHRTVLSDDGGGFELDLDLDLDLDPDLDIGSVDNFWAAEAASGIGQGEQVLAVAAPTTEDVMEIDIDLRTLDDRCPPPGSFLAPLHTRAKHGRGTVRHSSPVGGEIHPHDNDFLAGRGRNRHQHEGNLRLRCLVAEMRPMYHSLGKSEKHQFAKGVLEEWRRLTVPQGRVIEETEWGHWSEATSNKATAIVLKLLWRSPRNCGPTSCVRQSAVQLPPHGFDRLQRAARSRENDFFCWDEPLESPKLTPACRYGMSQISQLNEPRSTTDGTSPTSASSESGGFSPDTPPDARLRRAKTDRRPLQDPERSPPDSAAPFRGAPLDQLLRQVLLERSAECVRDSEGTPSRIPTQRQVIPVDPPRHVVLNRSPATDPGLKYGAVLDLHSGISETMNFPQSCTEGCTARMCSSRRAPTDQNGAKDILRSLRVQLAALAAAGLLVLVDGASRYWVSRTARSEVEAEAKSCLLLKGLEAVPDSFFVLTNSDERFRYVDPGDRPEHEQFSSFWLPTSFGGTDAKEQSNLQLNQYLFISQFWIAMLLVLLKIAHARVKRKTRWLQQERIASLDRIKGTHTIVQHLICKGVGDTPDEAECSCLLQHVQREAPDESNPRYLRGRNFLRALYPSYKQASYPSHKLRFAMNGIAVDTETEAGDGTASDYPGGGTLDLQDASMGFGDQAVLFAKRKSYSESCAYAPGTTFAGRPGGSANERQVNFVTLVVYTKVAMEETKCRVRALVTSNPGRSFAAVHGCPCRCQIHTINRHVRRLRRAKHFVPRPGLSSLHSRVCMKRVRLQVAWLARRKATLG
jgi:hypothetical protein